MIGPEFAAAQSPRVPSPGATMKAFQNARARVGGGDLAPLQDTRAPVVAVRVTADGRTLAALTEATLERAGLSVNEILERAGAIFDASPEAAAARRDRRARVSLELGGDLVPLTDAERDAPDLALSPGLDGVAVAFQGRVRAVAPGAMLARMMGPGRAIGSLVVELAGDASLALKSPAELADLGFAFYRFRVTHVAQPTPGGAGVFLYRGGRIIGVEELDTRGLRDFALGLASHLGARRWPGVEAYGLAGELNPISGRHEPLVESSIGQAVVAMSLARLARSEWVEPVVARRAALRAREILFDLATVEERERPVASSAPTAAAFLVALDELVSGPFEKGALDDPSIGASWEASRVVVGESFDPVSGFSGDVPPGAEGMIALALMRLGSSDGPEAVRTAFRETPPGLLATQMPWLALAERDRARSEPDAPSAEGALLAFREQVWAHQLDREDLSQDDEDLRGGIVFTEGRAPLPTSQTARPIAGIAAMLGDPALTPGTLTDGAAPGELERLLASLRFLHQLAAGREEGHLYARPDRAMWGVRRALWDARMPADASAVSLLAVCETLEALGVLAGRDGPP